MSSGLSEGTLVLVDAESSDTREVPACQIARILMYDGSYNVIIGYGLEHHSVPLHSIHSLDALTRGLSGPVKSIHNSVVYYFNIVDDNAADYYRGKCVSQLQMALCNTLPRDVRKQLNNASENIEAYLSDPITGRKQGDYFLEHCGKAIALLLHLGTSPKPNIQSTGQSTRSHQSYASRA